MMNTKNKGFTLIELMIVVAIIGIIGAVAFPSYESYMKKSRRADAKVGMTKIVDREERFYIQNNTYTTAITGAAGLNFSSNQSENGYYSFAITSTDPLANFTVTATALGIQTSDTDTTAGDCTTMTLDSTGLKTPAACW